MIKEVGSSGAGVAAERGAGGPGQMIASLRRDLEAMMPGAGRVRKLLTPMAVPRMRIPYLLRASQWLVGTGWGSALATSLQGMILSSTGAEISPRAVIGPGLCVVHSAGIVIGEDVVIGEDFRVFQGVTLGGRSPRHPGQPHIGNGVTIHAQAMVLGPVHVNDGVSIRAQELVLTDRSD